LSRGFDLPLIARFVLGRYWRPATPEQRDSYVELFGQFVIKTYSRRLGGFAGGSFDIVGAEPIGKSDFLVKTLLLQKSGPSFKAGWRVRLINDKHKIVDVMVEGISMALTQRQEFAAVLKRDGVERFLQLLSAKVGRMPAAT
jgi:phospholipid transport system substrate-binding protein